MISPSRMPLALLLLLLAATVVQSDTKTESYPLTESTAYSCQDIVDSHRFEGTCCALNVTSGKGCLLTVTNGRCKIRGGIWSLEYTSTSKEECPGSEFQAVPAPAPAMAPATSPGSSSMTFDPSFPLLMIIGSTVAALVLAGV